jgi:hypothetical protein
VDGIRGIIRRLRFCCPEGHFDDRGAVKVLIGFFARPGFRHAERNASHRTRHDAREGLLLGVEKSARF